MTILSTDLALIYDPIRNRYRGVYPSCREWQAIIQSKGVCTYLGRFRDQTEAAKAVLNWYEAQYGLFWRRVVTRTKDRRKRPWLISNTRGYFKAVVWVNGKEILITPSILFLEDSDPISLSDYTPRGWVSNECAVLAVKTFCKRFDTRPLRRHVLFRL